MSDKNNKRDKYFYYCNCVNWNSEDVDVEGGLCDMISDSMEISRKTFLKWTDKESRLEIERGLGYPSGKLTIAKDWAVKYYKSKLHGKNVYYLNHSAIEFVFCE